jgi:hypothetical protein
MYMILRIGDIVFEYLCFWKNSLEAEQELSLITHGFLYLINTFYLYIFFLSKIWFTRRFNGRFAKCKQTCLFIVALRLRFQWSFSMYFLWEIQFGTLINSNNAEASLFIFCKSSIYAQWSQNDFLFRWIHYFTWLHLHKCIEWYMYSTPYISVYFHKMRVVRINGFTILLPRVIKFCKG